MIRARATAALSVLLLAGCGELHNAPFRTGEIVGRVADADPDLGYVAVVNRPESRDVLEDDGSFELDELPAGTYDVLVVAAPDLARLLTGVQVRGGQTTDLSLIHPEPAASAAITLRTPSGQRLRDAVVWVQGLPLPTYDVDDDAPTATVGPLPAGCHEAHGFVEGLGEAAETFCVAAAQSVALEVLLPEPDGTAGREGCLRTGCIDELTCEDDGRCAP